MLQWLDSQHGWAPQSGTLTGTTDGGRTWVRLSGPVLKSVMQSYRIKQVRFVTPKYGWLVASNQEGSMLLWTKNGGETWHLPKYPTNP